MSPTAVEEEKYFNENYTGRSQGKPFIAYIGDDPVKDGGLAEQCRVPFLFVPFTHPGYIPNADRGQLLVQDFFDLHNLLDIHDYELKEGKPFATIFLGREDSDLYTPRHIEGIGIRTENGCDNMRVSIGREREF